jgi:hypothetical protein
MESNGFVPISLLILALALLGVMTLGVLGWKTLRFLQSLLTTPAPGLEPVAARRTESVELAKDDPLELPAETVPSISDRSMWTNGQK